MADDDKEKQEQEEQEEEEQEEQEQTNKNVNIINVHVNCCDHKKDEKDEDKKHWKYLYKKMYWDFNEGKYKEY
jgi:hypothetical protein